MLKVSVIVPNYNHGRYLRQRIDSVLNQTFQDFELIILDDCSTDNSKEIINQYALKDNRITVYLNDKNSGSTFFQWNKGVGLAKGEYVWIAESDDWAEVDLLETLTELLNKNPNAGIAYCQSNEVNEITGEKKKCFDGDPDGEGKRMASDFYNDGKNECSNHLLFQNTIPNASAVLFRKSIYLKAGNAPTHMKLCGDWMQWAKMLMISDIVYCSKSLNYFRQHQNTVRSNSEKMGQLINERYIVTAYVIQFSNPIEKNKQIALNTLMKKWVFSTKMANIPGVFPKLNGQKKNDSGIYKRFIKVLFLRAISALKLVLTKNKNNIAQ